MRNLAFQIAANRFPRHMVFVLSACKFSQRVLVLYGLGGQSYRIFIFFHGMVKDLLLFAAGFLVVDKVGKVEFGALPLEAHGVNQPSEWVGGNTMNPGASIINGYLVIANIADVRAAPYPIVRLQDQDRVLGSAATPSPR